MQVKYVLIQKRGDWQCSSRHAYLQYGTGPLLNLQLSIYLLLQFELHDYFCTILLTCIYFSVWIGSTNLAVSQLSAPFLVALCRRKSAFAILATFWLFLAYLLLLEGVVVSLVNCCVLLVALRLALNLESITSRILNLEGSTRPVNEPTFNLVPLRLTVWSWYLCWISECWPVLPPIIRALLAGGLEAVESIDLFKLAGFFDLKY